MIPFAYLYGGIANHRDYGTDIHVGRQLQQHRFFFHAGAAALRITRIGQKPVVEYDLEVRRRVWLELPCFHVFLRCLHQHGRTAFGVDSRNPLPIRGQMKPNSSLDACRRSKTRVERYAGARNLGQWRPGLLRCRREKPQQQNSYNSDCGEASHISALRNLSISSAFR